MEEYSVKYPATNADSSSGKSKGALFVSAKLILQKLQTSEKEAK